MVGLLQGGPVMRRSANIYGIPPHYGTEGNDIQHDECQDVFLLDPEMINRSRQRDFEWLEELVVPQHPGTLGNE